MSTSSDPRLGAIRLAWWRERLEELDSGEAPPAEPRLAAVAQELLPRRVSGKALSQLEDAWLPLLEPFPWGQPQADGLKLRGRILFGLGARLLASETVGAAAAGAFWSLADGAVHCTDATSSAMLLEQARSALAAAPVKLPRKVRALTVLAALAAADLVRKGSALGRLSAAVTHRLRGTLPRS